jgi:hypothetical protein
LGALGSLLFVQALPWGLGLMHGADLHLSWTRLLGCVIVVAGSMALGGLVAWLVGDATAARQAVAYGVSWQALLGGFLQGKRADDAEAAAGR